MSELSWIDLALSSARPQAMGALLRHFRNLDLAEEAFQEACLRAVKTWPAKGPPRDPVAWLIFVGRNSGIDTLRKRAKQAPLPPEDYQESLRLALAAHQALGCRGVSRTDLRYDDTGTRPRFYVLEVNTQPGMTPLSLVPEIAAHQGISYGELVEWMVEDAGCDR